eukprot:6172316-Pyramimonas_sp.AAC.1
MLSGIAERPMIVLVGMPGASSLRVAMESFRLDCREAREPASTGPLRLPSVQLHSLPGGSTPALPASAARAR